MVCFVGFWLNWIWQFSCDNTIVRLNLQNLNVACMSYVDYGQLVLKWTEGSRFYWCSTIIIETKWWFLILRISASSVLPLFELKLGNWQEFSSGLNIWLFHLIEWKTSDVIFSGITAMHAERLQQSWNFLCALDVLNFFSFSDNIFGFSCPADMRLRYRYKFVQVHVCIYNSCFPRKWLFWWCLPRKLLHGVWPLNDYI